MCGVPSCLGSLCVSLLTKIMIGLLLAYFDGNLAAILYLISLRWTDSEIGEAV